ncbi:MAG: hypothetical protein IJC07_01845 [Clostridia bacterium]|nr:hypothetical protein [Clostridia bacterium]
MKNKLISFLLTLMVVIGSISLLGCLGEGGSTGTGNSTQTNYNDDVEIVAPEDVKTEHFIAEEGTTYYTSKELYLCVSINGSYMIMEYFSIDGNKWVYDNLYFYEDDYIYMITGDYKDIYASLENAENNQYAEEEKEDGYDIQINIIKSGIYKLTFDVETLKFGLEFKAEITTPVYYTIKNCSIYNEATKWVEMSVNPANSEEFVINDFAVGVNTTVSFYSNIHTSHYKVTLDPSIENKYASGKGLFITVNVGGNYNIYVNRKTYVVRFELLNPETATYTCVHYNGEDFIDLNKVSEQTPYLFTMELTAEKNQRLPNFYSAKYRTYNLSLKEANLFSKYGDSYYFKQAGTYKVTIDLLNFEIQVEATI